MSTFRRGFGLFKALISPFPSRAAALLLRQDLLTFLGRFAYDSSDSDQGGTKGRQCRHPAFGITVHRDFGSVILE